MLCFTCALLEQALGYPADRLDDLERDQFLAAPGGEGLGVPGERFR
jgi:hypothetical protein